ncbi:hypothetical protein D5F01_LYC21273 [Larimichthys crocea]|uniref:Uncharacterized protein n=1 Tax=Larimichthys crocea TaxID=215358 RepID=A0A6G0HNG4_LARCR|nr:hypothetical protein D5F01_LYC21273 [Larimichthys crocea]
MPWWRNIFKKKKGPPVTTLKKDEVSQPLPATETQVRSPAMCSASDEEDLVEKEIPGEDARGTEEEDDLSPVNMRVSRNLHRFFTLRKAFAEIKPSAQDQDPSPTPSASSLTSETAEALVSDTLDRAKQKLNFKPYSGGKKKKEKTSFCTRMKKAICQLTCCNYEAVLD